MENAECDDDEEDSQVPTLVVSETHSHLFGKEILDSKYPHIVGEILEILATTSIMEPSKVSKEKGRRGQVVYAGPDFNKPLGREFKQRGWAARKVFYQNQKRYYIDVDFYKERIGLEIQMGKYAFVLHDLYKFQYLFGLDQLDVGVEIVPAASLQRRMYSGPATFESVMTAVCSHARNEPPIPLWFIGIDVV